MTWYRNAGRWSRYHKARPDWIRSGRAICGADIRRPGYVCEDISTNRGNPPCRRCLKIEKRKKQ